MRDPCLRLKVLIINKGDRRRQDAACQDVDGASHVAQSDVPIPEIDCSGGDRGDCDCRSLNGATDY